MKIRRSLLALPLALAAGLLLPASLRADSGSLQILKFEAVWCGPCKKMKPVFESVAAKHPDVSFRSVDVDKEKALASRYQVDLLPTVVAVKDGREVGRLVGFQNSAKLTAFVKRHR
jgi:thioredoxin 1